MNDISRRSFMKKVGGTLAGVVALGLPSKTTYGKFDPKLANIDSKSKWAKECKESVVYTSTYIQNPNYRMFFDRVLTQEEIRILHQEPFCMFKKPQNPVLNENHPLAKGLVSYELFTRT